MIRRVSAVLLVSAALAATPAVAQVPSIPEPPSTVGAEYVEPSATRPLQQGQKVERLLARNLAQPYVLQRLTNRTWWVQRRFASTTFYVGERGVLLFDPLEGGGEAIAHAIREVTPLPVTAVVYSHHHARHTADARVFVDAASRAGIPLRLIATQATAEKMSYLGSQLPRPNEILAWPQGAFAFEGLEVKVHGFTRAAHGDDHAVWLLTGERVLHAAGLFHPDQVPFLGFGGAENAVYLDGNLRQAQGLDWLFVNGGHGNVGGKEDIVFDLGYAKDLRQAVQQAAQALPPGTFVDPARANSHAAFAHAWRQAVVARATDDLRAKYGRFSGFDVSTPANAELIVRSLFDYR